MSFRAEGAKQFVINAFKKQKDRELRERLKKKGILTKILSNNQKKSNVLVDILRESDNFNTMRSFDQKPGQDAFSAENSNSNAEYLKPFKSTVVGRCFGDEFCGF